MPMKPRQPRRTAKFAERNSLSSAAIAERCWAIEETAIWLLMHPKVVELGKPRFNAAGHYADAVESVFNELNARVKQLYLDATSDVDIFGLLSSGLVSCAHALSESLVLYSANIKK